MTFQKSPTFIALLIAAAAFVPVLFPTDARSQTPTQPVTNPVTPPQTPPVTQQPNQKPGQPAGKRPPKPSGGSLAPPVTSQPGTPAAKPATVGELILREREREMILTVSIQVHADNVSQTTPHTDGKKTVNMPKITPFSYGTLGVVFPIIGETASSKPERVRSGQKGTPIAEQSGPRGVLTLDDAIVDDEVTVLADYPSGTDLGRWDAGSNGSTAEARQMKLEVTIPVTLYRTVFNEVEASKLGWPTSYPKVAQSTFTPQMFVEKGLDEDGKVAPFDEAPLNKALEIWKKEWGITEFTQVRPVALAKMIAAKVWETVQPTGDGLTMRARTGELSGIKLQAPAETLVTGRGSEHDLTVLLAVLYRKAGLPTRTVIGFDVGVDDNKFLGKGSKNNRIRTWVEFFLFDEAANTYNWIPVDIVNLRRSSSRPQKIDRPWKYFGTNDELDRVVPFAFQFHPPTDVVAYGSPGFWGWFVTPQPPAAAEQALMFRASAASKRLGDQQEKEGDDAKKPTKRRN